MIIRRTRICSGCSVFLRNLIRKLNNRLKGSKNDHSQKGSGEQLVFIRFAPIMVANIMGDNCAVKHEGRSGVKYQTGLVVRLPKLLHTLSNCDHIFLTK